MRAIHKIRKILRNSAFLKRFFFFLLKFFPVHSRYEINRKLRSPYSRLEDNNRVIFIHVPKTAGNALVKTLFGAAATGHDPLSRYLSNNSKKFKSYYKFAVVRNPYDRLVSSFFYLKQGGIGFFDNDFAESYLNDVDTFEEFVKRLGSDDKFRAAIMSWVHFVPQLDFVTLDGSNVALDRVIKLENIDRELSDLCEELRVPPVKMIRDNISFRESYKTYYTPELIDIVSMLYKDDLTALNYTYGD